MADEVRQKLAELIGRYGHDLSRDARRCEALLKDVCPNHKREVFVLVSAVSESVTADLLNSSDGLPKEAQLSRLTKRLNETTGAAENIAHWAVVSWALALGIAGSQDSSVPFTCPKCDTVTTVPTRFAGQTVSCPRCNTDLHNSADGRDVLFDLTSATSGQPMPAISPMQTVSAIASADTLPVPASTQAKAPSGLSNSLASSAYALLDELSGRKIHVNEHVAALFSPLYDRAYLDVATIQQVRSHLTAWADEIPHHKYRGFGASLSIREAARVPYYCVRLQTQYERRTVKRVTEPYAGWRIPQLRVSERNIDVWSYDWKLTTEFESTEKDYRIEDSQQVVECDTCGGEGQVVCPICTGSGRVRCRNCGGSGHIRQSKTVTKWRQVTKFDGRTFYLVDEPYEVIEYYQVQCVTCSANGEVTCHQCGGSTTVQCHRCRGSGRMVSLIVVANSFGPESDSHVHPNQWCNDDVAGLLDYNSDYHPALSLCGSAITPLMCNSMGNTPLQRAVVDVLAGAQARCCGTQRLLKQRLWIGSADVIQVDYTFQSGLYHLRLVGDMWAVHAPMSPLVKLVENTVTWVQERLENGEVGRGLKMLKRCFDMQQADHVVEPVFRSFRKRLADAYASEAASLGNWSAESRYFSDRAKQLEPAHSAASMHERAVRRTLNVFTFVPPTIAAVICALVGSTSNRPDVAVLGVATPVLLSILFWVIYVRRALNTVIVFCLPVITAAVSVMQGNRVSINPCGQIR
jgi:hypothetical protein